MENYQKIIEKFGSISLEDVRSFIDKSLKLERDDTKYVFPVGNLTSLLERLTKDYKILEIDNKRLLKYENLYFDTDDFLFYRMHHNKKIKRLKMRQRKYADFDDNFWEVKIKMNRRRTVKKRFHLDSALSSMTDQTKAASQRSLPENCDINIDLIKPKLLTSFSRMTLVNVDLKERITIDTDLSYVNNAGEGRSLPKIAIAELKQVKSSLRSPFAIAAKEEGIRSSQFSKYCIGVALLENNVKINRFKKRILNLKKLGADLELPGKDF